MENTYINCSLIRQVRAPVISVFTLDLKRSVFQAPPSAPHRASRPELSRWGLWSAVPHSFTVMHSFSNIVSAHCLPAKHRFSQGKSVRVIPAVSTRRATDRGIPVKGVTVVWTDLPLPTPLRVLFQPSASGCSYAGTAPAGLLCAKDLVVTPLSTKGSSVTLKDQKF